MCATVTATYVFACCEKPYELCEVAHRVSLAQQEQQQTHSQQPSHKAQHKVGYTRNRGLPPRRKKNIILWTRASKRGVY